MREFAASRDAAEHVVLKLKTAWRDVSMHLVCARDATGAQIALRAICGAPRVLRRLRCAWQATGF